jgi:hypothetical protein
MSRTVASFEEFMDGMREVQDRPGCWRKRTRQALHSRYAHMVHRTATLPGLPLALISQAPRQLPGVRPTLHRVFLTDDGEIRGHVRDLFLPEEY